MKLKPAHFALTIPAGISMQTPLGYEPLSCFHHPCSNVNLIQLPVWHKKGFLRNNRDPVKREEKNYSSARSVNTIDPEMREILIFTFMPGLEFATYMM